MAMLKKDPIDTAPEPLVVGADRLATLLAISVRTVRTLDYAGKLPRAVHIGGKVFWRIAEIREWLAAGSPDRTAWELMRPQPR